MRMWAKKLVRLTAASRAACQGGSSSSSTVCQAIGGEVDDRALQGQRTTSGRDFRAAHERARAFLLEPISRL